MDTKTYALCKAFTLKVAAGFSSVSVDESTSTINFILNDGTPVSLKIPQLNGITNIYFEDKVNATTSKTEKHLMFAMTDGSTIDAGIIPIGEVKPEQIQQYVNEYLDDNPPHVPCKISELDDISINNIRDEEVLVYNASSQKWVNRQTPGLTVSVETFGAKGDGTTDDTIAIQNAINEAQIKKATVSLSNGTYLISDRLKITASCKIIGAGQNLTQIKFTPTAKHSTSPYDENWWEESDSAIVIMADDVVLADFNLLGLNTQYNGISMHFNKENVVNVYRGSERTQIYNVTVKGFRNGVFLYAGWERYIHNCYFRDNVENGIYYRPLESSVTGNWSGSGDIIMACSFVNNATAGVKAEFSYNNILYDCVFEYNGRAFDIDDCQNLIIFNCWNEANYNNLSIKGSAKFVGGYNIGKDTITHDGNGYVAIEKPGDEIIFNGSDTIYRMQNGVIIKGVNIGTELDNKLKNIGFFEESHGEGKIASFSGWDLYDEYRWSVDKTTVLGTNYSAKFNVSGRTGDFSWFHISQRVDGFEAGEVIKFSASINTPDRTTIDEGIFLQIAYYTINNEVIDRATREFTPVSDNIWDIYTLESTVPVGSAYCKVFIGAKQNGKFYVSTPCCTNNEDVNLNKLYAELVDGVVTFKNINGETKGELQELDGDDVTVFVNGSTIKSNGLHENLIPTPYYHGSSKEVNGITFTVNSDGTIIANGTNTSSSHASFKLTDSSKVFDGLEDGKSYMFSPNCNSDDCTMAVYKYNGTDTTTAKGDSKKAFTYQASESVKTYIYIYIAGEATVNNLVIKPMLEKLDLEVDYVPYNQNRKQLSNAISSLNDTTTQMLKSALTLNYIDITSYNATTNVYTIPQDGYVRLSADSSSKIDLYMGATNGSFFGIAEVSNEEIPVFLRKGSQVYFSTTGTATAMFWALE